MTSCYVMLISRFMLFKTWIEMVYLINVLIMRSFAYNNKKFKRDSYVPELKEGNPCYRASVYDTVMYDETSDGDLIQCDMTQILLNQEKYRRLLGDMNVNNILAQMHPTQSTVMDGMTDEERFACVVSRHCQTMSERQAVLQQLANEKSELSAYAEAMLAEEKAAPTSEVSAPAASAQ
nr:MAG TPA: hypothetical protein [Microviridae sp.]